MQWEAPSKPLAVDDPLILPEREVHAEIGIDWFLDQGGMFWGEDDGPTVVVWESLTESEQ